MNPTKVIKKFGLFQFEEDATTTLWYVYSPLNLAQTANLLPKFKYHLPKFLGNGTISTNEHLVAFSNACHNIGVNDNDTCMRLFVNSFEGKIVACFFELLLKVFSTWDELAYWFKSTYGQPKIPSDQLQEYNNIVYKNGEIIKFFNLRFTKLYNQIHELIWPHNQVTFLHYYNALLYFYNHRLEEKNVTNLGYALQTCLEYEEQLERTGLPKEYLVKNIDMSIVLQLFHDMSNRMIAFERKGVTSTSSLAQSSTQVVLRNLPTNSLFHNQP
jgi:hypothetical protein